MSDQYDDIRQQKEKEADLNQKVAGAKVKRDKAKQSGKQIDFQNAVFAYLDVIKEQITLIR